MAFLSIFPNTPGVTVVIPKIHYQSDIFSLSDENFFELLIATRTVSKLLVKELDGVSRTALVFEGFGVDHVHAKLFPLHGTDKEKWEPIRSDISNFTDQYKGYISTHDSIRVDDEDLAEFSDIIRERG